ncbi:hypothetical protein [Nocardia yunnanensis]|uniref:hypothetical protein n=1 Tax=Nocardia yunnanensis TaxID=2382165 RepID=UPI0016569AF6|nr:hypothetical protein [Nocardia yunnanensis]
MTIEITTRRMSSDVSPEYAARTAGHWRLSWLPWRRLSLAQALAGMQLDELLSDPTVVDDAQAQAQAAAYAARLGIAVDRAVILLAQRLAERMNPDPAAVRADHGVWDPLWERTSAPEPVAAHWLAGARLGRHASARSRHCRG